jgi:hypothetical protein
VRFRLIGLHILRGNVSDAQVVYQTLLKKYPEGTPGSIYAKMAQVFWDNYTVTQNIGQACGKSLAIAIENQEIATRYLIDEYPRDGGGKPHYTIGELCPYK